VCNIEPGRRKHGPAALDEYKQQMERAA
jgi:hypothetical protein